MPLDLIRGHPHLNVSLKCNECRWLLKDCPPTRAPRLTTRQHHAPLTASCKALDSPPTNSQSAAAGDVGWFGPAGARNSPGTDQHLRQPVKS